MEGEGFTRLRLKAGRASPDAHFRWEFFHFGCHTSRKKANGLLLPHVKQSRPRPSFSHDLAEGSVDSGCIQMEDGEKGLDSTKDKAGGNFVACPVGEIN